jgi:hypothetical protein
MTTMKRADAMCITRWRGLIKVFPNPKVRPVLPAPWSLEFDFELFPNREIKEQEIVNLFEEAGMAIGLGTFRGVFGKYYVENWT